jgi:glycosyltransferase involved in cell wall biosynthesis
MTNKKTILIATGIYPPDIGGPATYSKLLNDELPKRGFSVGVLNFGDFKKVPKIIRHFIYGWKVFRLAPNYQIIYVQDPVSVGLPVCLACWFRRKDFILKIVGDYAWEQGSQRFGVIDLLDEFSLSFKKYSWPVKILKKVQTGVAKQAVKIIVPSKYLKKIVTNWGVAPEKIKVIYNSFDTPESLPGKEILRSKLDWSGRIIVSVGRLVPWKGFNLLIDIMSELIAKYPETKLFIVGSGPDRAKLERQIKERGLESSVSLTGGLTHQQVLEYLKASDLFVLNTSYEGFSHQLLEALWCEVPIITTAVGGNVELIENGKTGWLVNYNQREELLGAIQEVFASPEKTRGVINKGKEILNNFSKEKMLDNLIQEIS